MQILIRTDIGGMHGMGHVTRMLALARELRSRVLGRGATVAFIDATEPLRRYVGDFPVYGPYATVSWTLGDILIVDTKATDWANDDSALWFARNAGLKVVRIDHPQASQDSCDLLIGPVFHWAPETVADLRASFGTRFLYGADYVILGPEVTKLAPLPLQDRCERPIVFAAGGSDPTGALQQMYHWTSDLAVDVPLVFLIGDHAPGLAIPKDTPYRAAHYQVTGFDRQQIQGAQLFVTLFGQTCYEALWWQTPQLILSHTADNTLGGTLFANATRGGACFLGDLSAPGFSWKDQFLAGITSALSCVPSMCERAGGPLLDGRGFQRIASAILALRG